MTISFAVSWDYLCPFARNAHEHLLAGLEGGASWDVTFTAFSLGQAHVAEGEPDIWDLPEAQRYLYALAAGVTVRDTEPDRFPAFHHAMFGARHDAGRDIREESVVREVVTEQGLDADTVFDHFDKAVATIRDEHTSAVTEHAMFGVPTFVAGDRAVFVRLMNRPEGNSEKATQTIDGVMRVFEEMPNLNEYKFTKIPR